MLSLKSNKKKLKPSYRIPATINNIEKNEFTVELQAKIGNLKKGDLVMVAPTLMKKCKTEDIWNELIKPDSHLLLDLNTV
jgi:hypothetical protein